MKRSSLFLASFIFLIATLTFSLAEKTGNKSDSHLKPSLREAKPLLREIEFMRPRAYPFSEIPAEARHNAIKQSKRLEEKRMANVNYTLAAQPEWRCIGPGNIGGRVKSIAVHPSNTNIVYAAAAAGGIWKSTSGGLSWTPVFDFENAISFGSISLDKNNPDVIYAGTGEAVIGGGVIYLGTGMYKTTDAGNSWKQIGLAQCGAFSKVYSHPKNSNIVVAGAVIRAKGFYISKNAGETWEKLFDGNVTDIAINPTDENEYFIGVSGVGIYHTQNGGANWARRTSGINISAGIGRVSVQMAPSNPNVLYTLMVYGEHPGVAAIFKSVNKGATWQQLFMDNYSNEDYRSFFRRQGFYNNFIEIHPTNENLVIAGGIDIWRTTNGASWTNITRGYQGGSVHVDQHCGTFAPSNPNILYIGNDGGVYRSSDAGAEYTPVNNDLYITQFYAMAIDNTKANTNFGGTQDNGVVGAYRTQNWGFLAGGDGFTCIVDEDDPNIIYSEYYYGNIIKIDISSNPPSVYSATDGIPSSDEGLWHSPFIRYPGSSYGFFHGRHGIYFSNDKCEYWMPLLEPQPNRFSALAYSPVDFLNAYAGTEVGELYLSQTEGAEWRVHKTSGLPARYITSIKPSNKRSCTAYITYSGYGTGHVYRTDDCGETWNNISGDLPDVPCNDIEIHPDNEDWLFIATDVGVFASFNNGGSWIPYGKNLPRSPVVDMEFHTNRIILPDMTLRAATHGRSIWEVAVPAEVITDIEITSPAGGELYTGTTSQVISWSGFSAPVRIEYSFDGGVNWTVLVEEASGTSMRWRTPDRDVFPAYIRITSVANPSQTKISRSFSILKKSKGAIIGNSTVFWVPYGIAYDGEGGLWTTSFNSNQLFKLNADDYSVIKEIKLPAGQYYTDLTFDRENKFIFVHKMHSSDGNGGLIYVLDYDGNVMATHDSPARAYPIGLAYSNGKLIVGDRDATGETRKIYTVNVQNWTVESTVNNPFQTRYGPRCLCFDGSENFYQVSTAFPSGSIVGAYVLKIGKNDLSREIDRLNLESESGVINARGIEFDPRDNNFWITDFSGNIYKIAGFETESSVGEIIADNENELVSAEFYPNPANESAVLSFSFKKPANSVKISLFNILGEKIGIVFDRNINAYIANYARINTGALAPGVYYAVISADGMIFSTKSLIVIK